MYKIYILMASVIALSVAQTPWPVCNPATVEWFPHPTNCSLYIICFHGVSHEMSCAPGLHFNRNELKCMLPIDAECDLNYMCPDEDDDQNPTFLPDPEDCGVYYVCSRGQPIQRECAEGLWFDVRYRWCNFPDDVECDDRTVINPDNPGNRTTVAPPPVTDEPDVSACNMHADLFSNGVYLKSMCIISTSMNYEAARARCQSHNMNLFIIDNSIVQAEFFVSTTHLLRNQPGGFVWINGRRDLELNQWSIFHPDGTRRGALYDGVEWVLTGTVDGRNSGECLRYSQQHGPYQAMGVVCTANSWLICEHGMQSSEPTPSTTTPALTTTTTEPPVLPPNPAICWNATDLLHNGVYLKSLCIVNAIANYDDAQARCRANGMELFVISDFQLQAAFRTAITQRLQSGMVWINGRVDGDCNNKWYVFDPESREMFGGVHFAQTDTFSGRMSGPCLWYSFGEMSAWMARGQSCQSGSWFVCEFDARLV